MKAFPILIRTFQLVSLLFLAGPGCDTLFRKDSSPVSYRPPVTEYVTKESYLNGDAFCKRYEAQTSKEKGIHITVPLDYEDPSKGSLRLYAFTYRAFDPNKASVVFIDGGPGQNTHGIPDVFDEGFNEIHVDQRGLGCSALPTWELYQDSSLYSTFNTVRDLEAVRIAYGIKKWSLFGVSYGTIPATIYASQFPDATTSIVLEGTAFSGKTLHQTDYKVEKLNLVLATLNANQRKAFTEIVIEGGSDYSKLFLMLPDYFYLNRGMSEASKLLKEIISFEGQIQTAVLDARFEQWSKGRTGDHPQRPMATDGQVLNVIYCKELQARDKDKLTIDYDIVKNVFIEKQSESNSFARICDEVGVPAASEKPYVASQYPVSVPVYYFQGSHDGATLARGAFEHWRKVPQAKSYFLLNQKGGHNPSLSAATSHDFVEREGQQKLYNVAARGLKMTRQLVEQVNIQKIQGKWSFYSEVPLDFRVVEQDLDGIGYHPAAQ